MARLALFLLGSPRIERDGHPIAVDTRKAVALLAYLAVTRQRHSRDVLAGLLWPDYDESHARATLRRTLSALNRALASAVLDVDRERIGPAAGADLRLDVDDFHAHLAACQTHGHPPSDVCRRCLDPLARAADAYSDDFLAGFGLRDSPSFEDWQFFQREGLRRELASALDRLTRGHSAQGDYDTAIGYARRWLALDRLHEPAHCALLRLYAWSGQRAAALHQYRECVQVLDHELGVPPLETTTQLYEAIKENQPPAPPAPLTQAQGAPPTAAAPRREEPRADQAPLARPAAEDFPLLGRDAEWEELAGSYKRTGAAGHLVVLEGEAGIGKTRLADEFLADASRGGASVLAARCYQGEAGLAYGAFVAALRAALVRPEAPRLLEHVPATSLAEAARLVPELAEVRDGLPAPAPFESPGAQGRFFQGLCQTLLALCGGANAGSRGVVFLDDVQWADGASLDLLTYLARRLREYPLFLVLAWRSPDVQPDSQLYGLLVEAQRAGLAADIQLSRLSPDVIAELLRSRQTPTERAQEGLAERLYQETEGLPFFLVEYLSALGSGVLAPQADRWILPGGARDLLRSRLRATGEAAGQVLTAAAVIGRSFDFETVRAASGRSEEETIAALEELIAHGLVREMADESSTAPPSYDFSHEKLRTLVYDEISLARRRLLHRRVAEALVSGSRGTRDPRALVGRIAAHYLAAGNESEAAEYYKRAGERARALYANAEALRHLQTALALGHPDEVALHQAIGDLHTLLGEYADALKSYETAAALSPAESVAAFEQKIAGIYIRRGEWERAESHLRDALDAWGEAGPAAERARAYADWSLIARHLDQPERAQRLAEQALALAGTADDARALAQAHNMLGMLASAGGHHAEAISQLERSRALAERLNDPSVRIAALNNLALACAARGEVDQARALTEEALRLCGAQGDRHREAALHSNFADLLRDQGDLEGAREHVKASIAIYMEIGVEAGSLQPEIWKLTEW
jgi:DNA-binding SARP family transcriptional activator